MRLGAFRNDPLKALLGVDLADILSPMMVGPKFQRPVLGGAIDVYPLAIPDGEGLSIRSSFSASSVSTTCTRPWCSWCPSRRWTW